MKNIGNSLWKKDPFPNLAESLILMGLTALIVAATFSALALAFLGSQ